MDQAIPADTLSYFLPKSFQLPHLSAWSREIHQRNAIKRGLINCKNSDIILISDVDEIPNHTVFAKAKKIKIAASLEMNNYYYFINCIGSKKISVAKLVKYRYLLIKDPQEIRDNTLYPLIHNAGWHFSYLGGLAFVRTKIESFAHQEHNTPDNKKLTTLHFNITNGLDIFSRPFKYQFTKIDKTLPQYLLDNLPKFDKYIHHDQADKNTLMLRSELFKARSVIYWKELELQEVIKTMNYYRKYSLPHILAKIHEKLSKVKL